MRESKTYQCDVLIIGGSYAGLTAALAAADQGLDVILMDKATPANSGCARFAAGDIQCFMEEEDLLEDWVAEYEKIGEGLNDLVWLEENIPLVRGFIQKQIEQQATFLQNEEGKLIRKKGRGNLKSAIVNIEKTFRVLYQKAKDVGVKFLTRTFLVDLIVDENRVQGAIGLSLREDLWSVVQAKTVVLASGGCGYKGNYFGMDMATGDGTAVAYRNGARLEHMEFSNKYQSTHKDFNIYGMNRFVSQGGTFINSEGESFMKRYQPKTGDASNLTHLTHGIYSEIKAGRGPVKFDSSRIPEEDRSISNELLKPLMCLLEEVNQDFFESPQEWIPCYTGSVGATPAGLEIDHHYETSIQNLFAIGDVASKGKVLGACIGLGGIGMMFALLSGNRVIEWVKPLVDSTTFQDTFASNMEASLETENARFPKGDDAIRLEDEREMKRLLFQLEVSFMKDEKRLQDAIDQIKKLLEQGNLWAYADAHEQMKCYETWNMLVNALAFLTASKARKETRGGHLREDYQQKNDEFNSIFTVRMKDDDIIVERKS